VSPFISLLDEGEMQG